MTIRHKNETKQKGTKNNKPQFISFNKWLIYEFLK